MTFFVIINIVIFTLLLILLYKIPRASWSLSRKVMLGLLVGILFGLVLNFFYADSKAILASSISWFEIVGNGFVRLLSMTVIPLVFISILSAIAKLHDASSLGKISSLTLGLLLLTTMIAACIGVFVSLLFQLSSSGLIEGPQELERLAVNQGLLYRVSNMSVPDLLLSFIPKNPFAALANPDTGAIISVVLFAVFIGVAVLKLNKDNPAQGKRILAGIESLQLLVMSLVRLIISFTPFGIMALMTKVVANSNLREVLNLTSFIVASYLGLLLILLVHALLLAVTGINPLRFYKKSWSTLSFAFTSRSSAATIPLSIETQTSRIGVPNAIASFAASFGTTIGQNGCAGLYPAMLAVMVAPSIGINPMDPLWIITLVTIVTISSAGVAGVGGGATFAALIVLPAMGLPIGLVGMLISIEPLIDMGRTAVNVSGSMTAGTVTSQLLKQTDKSIFDSDEEQSSPYA